MPVGDETIRDSSGSKARDPLLGTTVGDYLIQAIIGFGAMGIVYRGTHQVIGKSVAIKVLKQDYATDPEMVQRLIREARTVNAIRHPAIVDIFGFGNLDSTGQPYIVMDLLEGEPLDAYIRREAPVSPKTALPILEELLGALGAAHGVGVIHRDLKPGNIFRESHPDQRSHIKVIDFGLARQSNRAGGSVKPTNPGTLLGTPAFMAPEQVLGERVTPATDLYAVGGIAYQLLTAHLPHEGPTAIDVLSHKLQEDPVRPRHWNPKLSEELDAWVMALLRKAVDARPSVADDVRAQLRRLIDGRTQGPAAVVARRSGAPVSTATSKRDWVSPKTVLMEGLDPGQPAPSVPQSTTDRQRSPFFSPEGNAPDLTPPRTPPRVRPDDRTLAFEPTPEPDDSAEPTDPRGASSPPDADTNITLGRASVLPFLLLGGLALVLVIVLIYVLVAL